MAPRFSIIPGRFVEDDRPDLNHYKVLNALGRHTDDDGWCRIKQVNIGKAIGLSRESVCRKLRDLVDWGYVQKEDEDGSGRAIWYRILHDAPFKPPKSSAEKPKTEHGLPVKTASQVDVLHAPTCEEQITPGVKTGNHTRCDAQASQQYNDPSQRSFLTSPPQSPHNLPTGPSGGGRGTDIRVDWIEDLRAEGQPHHVLDEFLGRLIAAGLSPWKDVDPRGPGRQACLDLARDPIEVIDALRERVLDANRYRIPPIAVVRELVATVRTEVERERQARRQLAQLPPVPVAAALTVRFLEALGRIAKPEQVAGWFDPAGVVSVTPRRGVTIATIVTRSPPAMVGQQVSSLALAACRVVWGAHCEVEFIQGRPVPQDQPGKAA